MNQIIYTGYIKIARFLISHGADINRRGCGLKTPLYKAAFNGKIYTDIKYCVVEYKNL